MSVARSRPGRSAIALAIVLVTALSLSACGSSKKSGTGKSTSTTAGGGTATTLSAPHAVTIQAKEYAFSPPGTLAEGDISLTLQNVGKEDHQVQLLHLKPGATPQQFGQAAQSDSTGVAPLALTDGGGGVAAVTPGKSEKVVNKVKAGTYMMVCFVRGADGIPHVAKGMVGVMNVVQSSGTGVSTPSSSTDVAAKEFSFGGPDKLSAGKSTVRFTNGGTQPHEMALVKLKPGKTAADLGAFFGSEHPSGPPPFDSAGGAGAVGPGDSAYLDVDLDAGTYVMVCQVPDPATKKPHLALGMMKVLTVG